MSWISAIIIGGGALLGGAISSHGATSAADTQASSANRAADLQLQMYQQTRTDQTPWRAAGQTALGSIMGGFGLDTSGSGFPSGSGGSSGGVPSGYFNHQFNANDLATSLDPSYGFRFGQGLGAATNAANRYGGGGNLIKGVTDYATGMAASGYQQAYQNYTANQTNIYNRLASIAGLGQTAGSNPTTGGSTFAGNAGAGIVGAGNAQAAGIVGQANAISGSLNNATGWYLGTMNPSPFAGASASASGGIGGIGGT